MPSRLMTQERDAVHRLLEAGISQRQAASILCVSVKLVISWRDRSKSSPLPNVQTTQSITHGAVFQYDKPSAVTCHFH